MAFSASVRRLLISSPGDVPRTDLLIIQQSINRWNGVYGEQFGSIIMPISWGTHAAAEFGQPPQQILNRQLVDKCDACIAIFANRLGTPTDLHESGTAEEISRLSESGKHVSILRCRRPVDASVIDFTQATRLNEYITEIESSALILDYSTDADLARHVETILVAAVSREEARNDFQLEYSSRGGPVAEVWPRVDAIDRSGKRNWYLVLNNTGDGPARDVSLKIEAASPNGQPWEIITEQEENGPDLPVLAPHSEVRYHIAASLVSASQVNCTVSWNDLRGEQENIASLRLA
ncbi:hypothetical protein [Streptomyces hokutonensis]|uniref:hypothetical protein n=1 Tax=Streptomyces hokutonensis TaxID=1306990 RepID=UPI00131A47D1|nr:hypothetical protein [Streptomyces hokutonensis]